MNKIQPQEYKGPKTVVMVNYMDELYKHNVTQKKADTAEEILYSSTLWSWSTIKIIYSVRSPVSVLLQLVKGWETAFS